MARLHLRAVAFLALVACGPKSPGPPVPVRPLGADPAAEAWYSQFSGYPKPGRQVIRTQAEWDQAWATLLQGMPAPPPSPAVDFDREMLLLAAMGHRDLLGFFIEISDAQIQDGTLLFLVWELAPGDNCAIQVGSSAPATVVRVQRFDGPDFALRRLAEYRCR